MRFGSHSHDTRPEKTDSGQEKRARLVALLRGLADRIAQTPLDRSNEEAVASAAETLRKTVDRALG